MTRLRHLTRRFASSLRPSGPGEADEAWARVHLNDGERRLWDTMSGPDRRHAVAVARRVEAELGTAATPSVLTAALLHDVGKTVAGLGTTGRVAATVSTALIGEDRTRRWAGRGGVAGRIGLYVDYPTLGVDLLRSAGSAPTVIAWSREHHLPEPRWTIDPRVGAVLAAADDEA